MKRCRAGVVLFLLGLFPASVTHAAEIEAKSELAVDATQSTAPGRWELGSAFSGGSQGPGKFQLSEVHLPLRYFLLDGLTIGAEARYWAPGFYPLASDPWATGRVWTFGATGQYYLFHNSWWGGYLGAALLWAPSQAQMIISPEVW